MEYYPCYADSRLFGYCIYCWEPLTRESTSKEHVPPKSLLDEPYAANLNIDHSCISCNNKFSQDEEYFSCIIECARCGSTNPDKLIRNKIIKTLKKNNKLLSKIKTNTQQSLSEMTGLVINRQRVKDVVIKICQGHAAYDLAERLLDSPSKIRVTPLIQMSSKVRALFESPIENSLLPEVGTRALVKILSESGSAWQIVQKGQYRFMVGIANGIIIKLVISEYLACEVIWSENQPKEDISELWIMPHHH